VSTVLRRHVLRNAFVPVLTVVGVQLASLLGGVIVVEVLFAWPGLGLLTYQAVQERDYPVLQGTVLLIAAIFILVNLVVDLLYAVVDPRISLR
jgi:peptide/nickel transport system permease protein